MAEPTPTTEVATMRTPDEEAMDFKHREDWGKLSIEELAKRQGVQPFSSPAEAARYSPFESDEEVEEFIAWVRAERTASIADWDPGFG
jgi:hypothetical protein